MKELIKELARRIKAGESANEASGTDLDLIWQFCEAEAMNRMMEKYHVEEAF